MVEMLAAGQRVLCRALSRLSSLTSYRSLTRPFPSISFSWLMALATIDLQ